MVLSMEESKLITGLAVTEREYHSLEVATAAQIDCLKSVIGGGNVIIFSNKESDQWRSDEYGRPRHRYQVQ